MPVNFSIKGLPTMDRRQTHAARTIAPPYLITRAAVASREMVTMEHVVTYIASARHRNPSGTGNRICRRSTRGAQISRSTTDDVELVIRWT